MKLPAFIRSPTPITYALAAIVLVLIIAVGAWVNWTLNAPRRAAEAKAGQVIAEGQAKAGSDAIGIADKARDAAEDSEDLTRENEDAIRKAKGADQPLDPDLNSTGLERVCHRAAYRCTSQCVQLLGRCDAKGKG